MAGYVRELARATVLYEDHSLVPTATPVVTGFMRLPAKTFTVTKTHTTGTYAMTLAWSMDGTNVAFTTTPSLTNNTPLAVTALAPYVRITITASAADFTVHQTTVMT